jgi:hypothetical protein
MCLKFDLNFYIENTENLMVELIVTSEKCYYVGLLIKYFKLDSYPSSVFSSII